MKRFFSVFCMLCLVLCLCCGMAHAEAEVTPEPTVEIAEDDLIVCFGMDSKEFAAKVGGYQATEWDVHITANNNDLYAYISVEGGTDLGWETDSVFQIMLVTDTYCLAGFRVGDNCFEARERALSEDWVLVDEADEDFKFDCTFEKVVDGVKYTLNLKSTDNAKESDAALWYVTLTAEILPEEGEQVE